MTDTPAMQPDELAEAAVLLRKLLALVEAGELEATTPSARAVLRRLEGAAIAAGLAAGIRPKPEPPTGADECPQS